MVMNPLNKPYGLTLPVGRKEPASADQTTWNSRWAFQAKSVPNLAQLRI